MKYKFYVGECLVYSTNVLKKAKEMAHILTHSSWKNKLIYNSIP